MISKAKIIILVGIIVCSGIFCFNAEAKKKKKVVDIYEMSLDENLSTPSVGKQSEVVAAYQLEQAKKLQKNYQKSAHWQIETMRDGEVIVISVPTGQLFNPNDTVLTELGKVQLQPLLKLLENKGFYKMILAVHTDNTGSELYTFRLSRGRVNAIFDWIGESKAGLTEFVVPYALGGSDPVVPNNSVENRKMNRRLEIYLVPGNVMVEGAKKGLANLYRQK